MRGSYITVALGLVLATAAPALAQTSGGPVSRADVAGTLGWFNARASVPDIYDDRNDWYNRSLYGGASAGWYWTDNWKTEVEAGGSTTGEIDATRFVGGGYPSIYSTYRIRMSKAAIGQHYQLYRNAWVHPFFGGGVDFTWESIDRSDEVFSSWPVPGNRVVDHPRQHEFHVRPFATLGLKAYMTPHGFFRTDMKFVASRHGLDEVSLRIGFGIDF